MTIPADLPKWATDANFTNGPDVGTPTKVEPTLGVKEEGFVGGSSLPSQRLNYLVNQLSAWTRVLAGGVLSNLRLVQTLAGRDEIKNLAYSPTNDPEAGDMPLIMVSINHNYHSPNGGARSSWVSWPTNPFASFKIARWVKDRFIGVSSGASGVVQGSTDGVVWAVLTMPFAAARYDLADDGTIIVIASGTTTNGFATSTDGTTWTARDSGESSPLKCVVYDGTYFVAGGASGVRYSTDGITWTAGTHPSGVIDLDVAASDGAGTVLMAEDGGSTDYFLTTDHGQTWTTYALPFTSLVARRIAYVAELGLWTMHARPGLTSLEAPMAVSTDGVNWTLVQVEIPTGQQISDVLWTGDGFTVLADDATDLYVYKTGQLPADLPFHL